MTYNYIMLVDFFFSKCGVILFRRKKLNDFLH